MAIPMAERPLTPILQTFEDAYHPFPEVATLRRMVLQFRSTAAEAGIAFYNWNSDQARTNLGGTNLWKELVRAPIASQLLDVQSR
jgi:hypothetical protein